MTAGDGKGGPGAHDGKGYARIPPRPRTPAAKSAARAMGIGEFGGFPQAQRGPVIFGPADSAVRSSDDRINCLGFPNGANQSAAVAESGDIARVSDDLTSPEMLGTSDPLDFQHANGSHGVESGVEGEQVGRGSGSSAAMHRSLSRSRKGIGKAFAPVLPLTNQSGSRRPSPAPPHDSMMNGAHVDTGSANVIDGIPKRTRVGSEASGPGDDDMPSYPGDRLEPSFGLPVRAGNTLPWGGERQWLEMQEQISKMAREIGELKTMCRSAQQESADRGDLIAALRQEGLELREQVRNQEFRVEQARLTHVSEANEARTLYLRAAEEASERLRSVEARESSRVGMIESEAAVRLEAVEEEVKKYFTAFSEEELEARNTSLQLRTDLVNAEATRDRYERVVRETTRSAKAMAVRFAELQFQTNAKSSAGHEPREEEERRKLERRLAEVSGTLESEVEVARRHDHEASSLRRRLAQAQQALLVAQDRVTENDAQMAECVSERMGNASAQRENSMLRHEIDEMKHEVEHYRVDWNAHWQRRQSMLEGVEAAYEQRIKTLEISEKRERDKVATVEAQAARSLGSGGSGQINAIEQTRAFMLEAKLKEATTKLLKANQENERLKVEYAKVCDDLKVSTRKLKDSSLDLQSGPPMLPTLQTATTTLPTPAVTSAPVAKFSIATPQHDEFAGRVAAGGWR